MATVSPVKPLSQRTTSDSLEHHSSSGSAASNLYQKGAGDIIGNGTLVCYQESRVPVTVILLQVSPICTEFEP